MGLKTRHRLLAAVLTILLAVQPFISYAEAENTNASDTTIHSGEEAEIEASSSDQTEFVSGNQGEATVTVPNSNSEDGSDVDQIMISKFGFEQKGQVAESYDLADELSRMPTEVEATLSDGSTIQLPATWVALQEDVEAFEANPDTTDFVSYRMVLPEGYSVADDDLSYLPEIILNFRPLHMELGTHDCGIDLELSDELSDDSDYATYSANNSGIATYATTYRRVNSYNSAIGNLIIDSETLGNTIASRHYHYFDNDKNEGVFCYEQGALNPDGKYDYYMLGYANQYVAAILDAGWPHTMKYNTTTLSDDQARQATQIAIWCYTNHDNKNTVTMSKLKAYVGRDGAAEAYGMADYLVTVVAKRSSNGKYEVWETVDRSVGQQAVVSIRNRYEEKGSLQVQKASYSSSIPTSGDYNLGGAVYYVYSDSALTKKVGELKTGSDGKSNILVLNVGTYYLKEITAPKNYKINTINYSGKVTLNNTCVVKTYDSPVTGTISIQKSSSNTSITNGNSNYSLKGASFRVYDSSGKVVGNMTTDANGKASMSGLKVGTYTIKEIWAPLGYMPNTQTYTAKISSGGNTDITVNINVPEPAAQGYIELNKSSADPDVTDNDDSYSLKGAVYSIYTDKECTDTSLVGTMETDEKGYAKSGLLPLGTYYVKETIAPPHYALDKTVYTATVTQKYHSAIQNNGYTVTHEYQTRGYDYLAIRNFTTSYSSVKFDVWSKSDKSDLKTYNGIKETSTGGWYTYIYPQEISGASKYYCNIYGSNGNGWTYLANFEATYDYSSYITTLNVTDQPALGWVELYKSSYDTEITQDNRCYSLEGAIYGVYSDRACTDELTRITTDKNGHGSSSKIQAEYVYIKEITPPAGYELDDFVYTVKLNSGVATKVNVRDVPANDAFGLTITKIPANNETENIPSLAGAQFEIRYYDGQYNNVDELPSIPTRTWTIETQEVQKDGKTAYIAELNEDYKVDGEEFYYIDGVIRLPLGTIAIEEITPPDGYTIDGAYFTSDGKELDAEDSIVLLHVTQNSDTKLGVLETGNKYIKEEETGMRGSITLNKKDEHGKALSGTEFTLEIQDTTTGEWKYLSSKTTNNIGQVKFTDLDFATYRITETKSAAGKTLLTEPIIVTIPYASETEIPGSKLAYTNDGINYYCDVSFDVSNSATFKLPLTGGTQTTLIITMSLAFILIIIGTTYIIVKRKKKK